METRDYAVDFYRVDCRDDNGKPKNFSRFLDDLVSTKRSLACKVRHGTYELRDLRPNQTRQYIGGVIARFRMRDLPHAGRPNGKERGLGLADEEGLLEKCHFVYVRAHNVLVYQRNRIAAGPGTFGLYFTALLGHTTVCHPILQLDPMKRLIHHSADIKEVDVQVARPRGRVLSQIDGKPNWSHNVFDMMETTGAYTIRTVIRGNGHAKDSRKFLQRDVLRPFAQLFNSAVRVRRARVKYEADADDPGYVDLLQDRMSQTVTVESNDRYPNSDAMWWAQSRAWEQQRDAIREVIELDDETGP